MENPSRVAEEFLHALFRQSQLAAAKGKEPLASKTWNESGVAPEDIDACHRLLTEAQRSGAVGLDRGKGFKAHVIRCARVADVGRLAAFLGQPLYSVRLADMEAALAGIVEGREEWLGELFDQCRSRWARGEAAYGLRPGDVDAARETLLILRAVTENRHRGKTSRDFSVEVTGRSKALEERRQHVIAGLRRIFSFDETVGTEAILEAIGFQKFHQPVLIRGKLEIAGVSLDLRPYVGLPPERVKDLTPRRGFAPYLISIENLTSFNRYVREIEDDGAVVYTGGFPSRPVLAALVKLADAAGTAYHWGDIDPGGVRIFRSIEHAVPGLRPHKMDPETAKGYGRETPGEVLSMAAFDGSAITETVRFLACERTWKLEQEALEPVSPIKCKSMNLT